MRTYPLLARTVLTPTLILLALFFFGFSSVKAQMCDWTIENQTDCNHRLEVLYSCNGNPPVSVGLMGITFGGWYSPSFQTFPDPNPFCTDPNCTPIIMIDGVPVSTGSFVCCPGGNPANCIQNQCGEVTIDPTTMTITIRKPSFCP